MRQPSGTGIWELQGRIAEIVPGPAPPLAAWGWAASLTRVARALGRTLTGSEPAVVDDRFFRVVRGRVYTRHLSRPLASVLLDVPDASAVAASGRAALWLRRGAARAVGLGACVPWRARALLRSAPPAFETLEAKGRAQPLEKLSSASDAALLATLAGPGAEDDDGAWLRTCVVNMYAAAAGELFLDWLREILEDGAGDDGTLFLRVIGRIGGIRSTEPAAALADLARRVLEQPALTRALLEEPPAAPSRIAVLEGGAELLDALHRFAAEHGHRGFGEGDGSARRWAEAPDQVLRMFRNLLATGGGDASIAPDGAAVRLALDEARARLRWWRPDRRLAFEILVRHVHALLRCRENSKNLLVARSFRERATALELDRRLRVRGLLSGPDDDVLFLLPPEIGGALAGEIPAEVLAGRIAARREAQARDAEQPPPEWIDEEGRACAPEGDAVREPAPREEREPPSDPDTQQALGVSAGRARGRARVVRDPRVDADVPAGSVLVAPYTDDAWSPLFFVAAAVVVETGSVLAHAAIVARELGVPCVMAALGATRRYADGELLEVDGGLGTIRRIGAPTEPRRTTHAGD